MDNANATNLFDTIQAEFAAGRAIAVVTYARMTVYHPKHAAMFRRSSREGDTGVYVQAGRKSVYVMPSIVKFQKAS